MYYLFCSDGLLIFRQIQKNGKVEQEVVYEDYFTSMGIPYVEYTKYDLKKDCPDLVFTSNPYDSTVLPQFCLLYTSGKQAFFGV